MEIKHFAGYGKVTAKKITDKKHTLHIRVEGNHERGITLRKNDTTAMFDWLVQEFDKKLRLLVVWNGPNALPMLMFWRIILMA